MGAGRVISPGRTELNIDLSATGRARVVAGTALGIVLCVSVALIVDSFSFASLTPEQVRRSILTDILVPTCLAGPLLWFLLSKMRQLALTQEELATLASTDSLTEILNRGAFKMLVDAYLTEAKAQPRTGAFLVVDADHFKSINDRYGHDRGDQALRVIAQTFKAGLQGADIVGRLGGEEFGVFLPGASTAHAHSVGERIRHAIAHAGFSVGHNSEALSVSVGGVCFAHPTSYDALFVAADDFLYRAKSAGRNRVEIGMLGHGA